MKQKLVIFLYVIVGLLVLSDIPVVYPQAIVFQDDNVGSIDNRYDLNSFIQNQFNPSDDNNFFEGRPNRRPRPRPRPPRPTQFPDFRPTFSSTGGTNSGNAATPSTTTTRLPETYYDCVARCPITSQYNPVCGTNMVTYDNISRLRCARQCGLNTDVSHQGPCQARG